MAGAPGFSPPSGGFFFPCFGFRPVFLDSVGHMIQRKSNTLIDKFISAELMAYAGGVNFFECFAVYPNGSDDLMGGFRNKLGHEGHSSYVLSFSPLDFCSLGLTIMVI